MGLANILVVRDDAIHNVGNSEAERKRYDAVLGAAVLKLCLDPDYERTEKGPQRVTDAGVVNHTNGVTWVDEIHSTDRGVYVWMRNCLRPIAELNKEELTIIKDTVDHQNPKPLMNGRHDPAISLAEMEQHRNEAEQRGLPLQDGHRWGRWALKAGSLSLEPEHGGGHYIDLERIKDPASMLHEMFRLWNKQWMSPGDWGTLLSALEEIFDPQETLFSEGETKTINSTAYLRQRIVQPPAESDEE